MDTFVPLEVYINFPILNCTSDGIKDKRRFVIAPCTIYITSSARLCLKSSLR